MVTEGNQTLQFRNANLMLLHLLLITFGVWANLKEMQQLLYLNINFIVGGGK